MLLKVGFNYFFSKDSKIILKWTWGSGWDPLMEKPPQGLKFRREFKCALFTMAGFFQGVFCVQLIRAWWSQMRLVVTSCWWEVVWVALALDISLSICPGSSRAVRRHPLWCTWTCAEIKIFGVNFRGINNSMLIALCALKKITISLSKKKHYGEEKVFEKVSGNVNTFSII